MKFIAFAVLPLLSAIPGALSTNVSKSFISAVYGLFVCLFVVHCAHSHFYSTSSSAVSSSFSSCLCLHLQLEPRLRGPVLVAVSDQDDTDRGYSDGQQQATYFWTSKFNSDCNSISSYDDMIANYIISTPIAIAAANQVLSTFIIRAPRTVCGHSSKFTMISA
jgi:hypothetical protein